MKLCSSISNEVVDYHPVRSLIGEGVSHHFVLKVISEINLTGVKIISKNLMTKKQMLIECDDYVYQLNYVIIDFNTLPKYGIITEI